MSRRERKVVTVLFCDLVGFTARAESLDPEDVEALLGPYHQRVRSELERHGGTVEKFIGDAVMALFGAPVAHEDDPERAVRAALAIRDFAAEEGLELRIGVTTGEALVRLDAQPEAGEGMASGDVVNTAARLQSAAPVNGVLVDETTYRTTRHAIDYREAEPVAAKGKPEPVSVWEAIEARARLGTEVLDHVVGELVGRNRELRTLRDALDRVRDELSAQLVTLVGVPGIGKSRLLHELSRIADAEPELITWRQGRCLAYGDGVTFWALSEIIKAQAGILEADSYAAAAEKLHRAVHDVVEPNDAAWVEAHLRPLAGLGEESELGGDRRGEAFAAWRHFVEELAAHRPLVLVFEDLQWADDGLLDFVDELADWTTGVPLLVVCTARPELLGRRAGWGGGKLNATTLALEPLSDEQTARVVSQVLERPMLPADVQHALLDRAGGNPLYAEQFAQLFLERGSADDLPLPETLQGLIAARLDDLPPEEKTLLQSAAVVGKVFWSGSVATNGRNLDAALHALERKAFIRRQRRSSVPGETELAFAHALVRDVAYGQIPRAERSERHRFVAEWIESLGRLDDHAEMLAHHWRSALELARLVGGDTAELAERACIALRNAGDRAFALNAFVPAEAYYAEALALSSDESPDRPELLFRRAEALFVAADERREPALEEARDALLAAGNTALAAEAEAYLSRAAWFAGRGDAQAHVDRAAELLEGTGPSVSKTRVLSFAARLRFLDGDLEGSLLIAREALSLAEQFQLDDLRVHALTTIGSAKQRIDPWTGQEELERALEIGLAANSPLVPTVLNNLGVQTSSRGDIRRAGELYRESAQVAERLGDRDSVRFAHGNLLYVDFVTGQWDDFSGAADRFIAECETSPHYQEGAALLLRAYVRFARGDQRGALADWERALVQAREVKDPQRLLPALLQVARGYVLIGRVPEARALASEALDVARSHPDLAATLGHISGVAQQLGLRDDMREVVAHAPESVWKKTAAAGAEGDFLREAEIFGEAGAVALEAESRFWAAKELIAAGRRSDGETELEKALEFYRSVDATFYLARGEALLAQAATG